MKLHCEISGKAFEFSKQEEALCRFFEIPFPELSPAERFRRMLTFRNERRFFWRNCSKTGRKIFSSFPAAVPFPVIDAARWWSTDFDAGKYEKEYNPKLLFFNQLSELWFRVPRPAYVAHNVSEVRAVNNLSNARQSLLTFASNNIENVYYSFALSNCRECVDCHLLNNCASCYFCVDCHESSKLRWAEHCVRCEDCSFCFNLDNCRNCIYCANLSDREYCIFNRQVTATEYEAFLNGEMFTNQDKVEEGWRKYLDFLKEQYVPERLEFKCQNVSGNYLYNCRNVVESFACSDSHDLALCYGLRQSRECYQALGIGEQLEKSANVISSGLNARNLVNCLECWDNVSNLTYCGYCTNSENLLGCVGLRGREFCILNRQYTEVEYRKLFAEIRESMCQEGVWGQFFPMSFSGYAYNYSSAIDYMPLNQVQAKMLHFVWDESEDSIKPSQLLGRDGSVDPVKVFAEMPTRLEDLDMESAFENVYLCELSGAPYQLSREEVKFYHRMKVAPPVRSYETRAQRRLSRLAPQYLLTRPSSISEKVLVTAFPANWRQPVVSMEEFASMHSGI